MKMETSKYISEDMIKHQSWKYYFVIAAWPLYLLVLPLAFNKIGFISILFMIFPGVFLFTWVGFLMHESWHKYVPNIANNFFYVVFSWMLITDPQLYKMLHGGHHLNVNSWEDREFHPLGKIGNRALRKIYNCFEIILGIVFIVAVSSITIPFNSQYKAKYRFKSLAVSIFSWIIFLGGIGFLSHVIFGVSAWSIIIPYVITLWICSFVLHHSQLVEHGNLIAEGNWNQRNLLTRNLKGDGVLEKIFLFLTHGDSREHVLHHTLVTVYSRPFPGKVPMPEKAVYINIKGYLSILWGMVTKNA
jgi:fatty acid desaturase